jgi:hypothetical protein
LISVNRRIVLIGGAPFLFLLPPAREPFRSVSELSLAFRLFFWQKPSHDSVIHARQPLNQAD